MSQLYTHTFGGNWKIDLLIIKVTLCFLILHDLWRKMDDWLQNQFFLQNGAEVQRGGWYYEYPGQRADYLLSPPMNFTPPYKNQPETGVVVEPITEEPLRTCSNTLYSLMQSSLLLLGQQGPSRITTWPQQNLNYEIIYSSELIIIIIIIIIINNNNNLILILRAFHEMIKRVLHDFYL